MLNFKVTESRAFKCGELAAAVPEWGKGRAEPKGRITFTKVVYKDCTTKPRLYNREDFKLNVCPSFYDYRNDSGEEAMDFYTVLSDSLQSRSINASVIFREMSLLTVCDTKDMALDSPVIVEKVPLWNTVDRLAVMSNIGGGRYLYEGAITPFTEKLKNNLLYLPQVHFQGCRGEEKVRRLLETLISGFSAVAASSYTTKGRRKECCLHLDNVGLESADVDMALLCELYAASVSGIGRLYLHKIQNRSVATALERLERIPSGCTNDEVATAIAGIAGAL